LESNLFKKASEISRCRSDRGEGGGCDGKKGRSEEQKAGNTKKEKERLKIKIYTHPITNEDAKADGQRETL
jgi:hypothetical protein